MLLLPVADFTSSPNELTACFTNLSTTAVDPETGTPRPGTLTYEWDFGDSSTDSSESPCHTYAQFGTYNVTLTTTDENGYSNQTTIPVTLTPMLDPLTGFNIDKTGDPTFTFTNNSSHPYGASIRSMRWDFGDGTVLGPGTPDLFDTVTHTYALNGTYSVRLTVVWDDPGGTTGNQTKQVLVDGVEQKTNPRLEFTLVPGQPYQIAIQDDSAPTGGLVFVEGTAVIATTEDPFTDTGLVPPQVLQTQNEILVVEFPHTTNATNLSILYNPSFDADGDGTADRVSQFRSRDFAIPHSAT